MRAARLGSSRSLLYGALAAGLATGTKYNLGMLVVPGIIACGYVYRDDLGPHRLRPWAHASRAVSLPQWPSPFL